MRSTRFLTNEQIEEYSTMIQNNETFKKFLNKKTVNERQEAISALNTLINTNELQHPPTFSKDLQTDINNLKKLLTQAGAKQFINKEKLKIEDDDFFNKTFNAYRQLVIANISYAIFELTNHPVQYNAAKLITHEESQSNEPPGWVDLIQACGACFICGSIAFPPFYLAIAELNDDQRSDYSSESSDDVAADWLKMGIAIFCLFISLIVTALFIKVFDSLKKRCYAKPAKQKSSENPSLTSETFKDTSLLTHKNVNNYGSTGIAPSRQNNTSGLFHSSSSTSEESQISSFSQHTPSY